MTHASHSAWSGSGRSIDPFEIAVLGVALLVKDHRCWRLAVVLPAILLLAMGCVQTKAVKHNTTNSATTASAPPAALLPVQPALLVFEIAPLGQPVVSSTFGQRKNRMHKGVDFAAPFGSEVLAVSDGVVLFVGRVRGYGRIVELIHESGVVTRYAHLASFGDSVEVGAEIPVGTVIGTVGTSGRTTGPNLHFEVLVANLPIDPLERLPLE